MRQSTQTAIKDIYLVEIYEKHCVFSVHRRHLNSEWLVIAYDEDITHCGSYKLTGSERFVGIAAFKARLKEWYPQQHFMSFYPSLKSAIKNSPEKRAHIIVKKIGSIDDEKMLGFELKKKKKVNPASPKRKNHYYCDCRWCVGVSHEDYLRQIEIDEKKIHGMG